MNIDISELATELAEKLKPLLTKEAPADESGEVFMTTAEAAEYLHMAKAQLYKLTMSRQIPYTRPRRGKCLFKRSDLQKWIEQWNVPTDTEITRRARNYSREGR